MTLPGRHALEFAAAAGHDRRHAADDVTTKTQPTTTATGQYQ